MLLRRKTTPGSPADWANSLELDTSAKYTPKNLLRQKGVNNCSPLILALHTVPWFADIVHSLRTRVACMHHELTIIGTDNDLSPGRRQAIIQTNAGILLIVSLGTNISEILIQIHTISFKNMRLKMSSAKWRPFCLGLNELTIQVPFPYTYRTGTTV